MDSFDYKTIMTPRAIEMLDDILVYIETEYQAPETARAVYRDSLKTRKQLESLCRKSPICR